MQLGSSVSALPENRALEAEGLLAVLVRADVELEDEAPAWSRGGRAQARHRRAEEDRVAGIDRLRPSQVPKAWRGPESCRALPEPHGLRIRRSEASHPPLHP